MSFAGQGRVGFGVGVGVGVIVVVVVVVVGLSQQSNPESPAAQLFVPQTRFPAQSLSESQSPSPRLHGLVEEQQVQSLFAGLHVVVV